MNSSEKSGFVALFDTNTGEIYGQTPFFYFRISADPKKSYYYKAYVNNDDKKENMTDEEISYLFKLLKKYADKGAFQTLIHAIEDRYLRELQERHLKVKKETYQTQVSKNTPNVVRHNNQNQEMRKVKQRDKQLAKYSSIAPVVIKNNEGVETALCAKLNDEYFYVSLDEKKPAFYKVSLAKGDVMDVYDVGTLLEFVAESEKTVHIATNLALLYKKFRDSKVSSVNKGTNEVCYSVARIHLAKGLQGFSPLERKLCQQAKRSR